MRKILLLGVAAAAVYMGGHPGTLTGHHAAASSGPVTRNANERLANQMATSGYGWRGGQLTCLDELWTEESGFDAYAANPTSDARGIPQKITGWSADYQPGNARQQVAWGLSYVKGRYVTPCAAWAFETSHTPNWY